MDSIMDSIISKHEFMKNISRVVFDNVWNKVRYSLDRYSLDDKLKEQAINPVNTRVSNRVSEQIRNQLWLQVRDQTAIIINTKL
jgi:dTDP-D-glucose 4,6-dehydratase